MRKATIAAAVILVVAVAGAFTIYAIAGRGHDDESRLRAFFTLPTPTRCGAADAVDISVGDRHFAAFVEGDIASKEGKFLLVTLTAAGERLPSRAALASRFVLAEPSGKRYVPIAAGTADQAAPSSPRQQELVFDVPLTLSAAKLILDDGCAHQEWIAP